jgi:hypothetical protein
MLLLASGLTGSVHIVGWLLASTSSCELHGVGLGGAVQVCSGTLSPTMSAGLFALTFLSAPLLLTLLLRRQGQPHAALLACPGEIIAPIAMIVLVWSLLPSSPGISLVWEATTLLVAIPIYLLVVSGALKAIH